MYKSDPVKLMLLGNLIGIIDSKEVVSFIDEMILKNIWQDDFEDLMDIKFYTDVNIKMKLSKRTDTISIEDFKYFERKFYPYLIANKSNFTWEAIEKILYRFINIKIDFLGLTSNDISDYWFSIINNYELRINRVNSSLAKPQDIEQFILLLNQSIWKDNFISYFKE